MYKNKKIFLKEGMWNSLDDEYADMAGPAPRPGVIPWSTPLHHQKMSNKYEFFCIHLEEGMGGDDRVIVIKAPSSFLEYRGGENFEKKVTDYLAYVFNFRGDWNVVANIFGTKTWNDYEMGNELTLYDLCDFIYTEKRAVQWVAAGDGAPEYWYEFLEEMEG